MVDPSTALRYVVAAGLIAVGIAGTAADLLGFETLNPAYFAVLIAAGAAAAPPDAPVLCRLRARIRRVLGRSDGDGV